VKPFRWGLLAALVGIVLALAPAAAAATYTDSVSGIEIFATSTQGIFTGTASGDLPGRWQVTVNHTPLSPDATITGGSLNLATTLNGSSTLVTAQLTGGTVVLAPSSGCTNQQYSINATLGGVGTWYSGSGTGTFTGTLTHYRTSIFGRCVTYSASVTGGVTLNF
jgi:hypothetical protein